MERERERGVTERGRKARLDKYRHVWYEQKSIAKERTLKVEREEVYSSPHLGYPDELCDDL